MFFLLVERAESISAIKLLSVKPDFAILTNDLLFMRVTIASICSSTSTRTLFWSERQRKSTSRRSRKNTSPPHFYFLLNSGLRRNTFVLYKILTCIFRHVIWKCFIRSRKVRRKLLLLEKMFDINGKERDTFMRSVRNVLRCFNTFNVKRQCFVDVADYFFGSVRTAMSTKRRRKMQRTRLLLKKTVTVRFYGGSLKLKMFENVRILYHCCFFSWKTCTLVISLD